MSKEQEGNVIAFQSPILGELRAYKDEDGKEWFCLRDVAKSLGIENQVTLKERLSAGGIRKNYLPTKNQHGAEVIQKATFIDEPNLYRCIFRSNKPEAEAFQTWVFEKVLPTLRRNDIPNEPNTIAGVSPLLYRGAWYYPYNELCRAIGYTIEGDFTQVKTWAAKKYARETRVLYGRIFVTQKLAELLAELRRHEVAKKNAILRFEAATTLSF